MADSSTRIVRAKMFGWAAISFIAFGAITYYRWRQPDPKPWWDDPARDLALGIFPLGLSILCWEFFLRKDRDQEIIGHVESALASRLSKLGRLEEYGLIGIRTAVSNVELGEFMDTAKHKISVLVPFFVDPTVLESKLCEKMAIRNFILQVTLMDPASIFLKQRSRVIFKDSDVGTHEVRKTLLMLSRVEKCSNKGKLEVRTFDSLPSLFIVRCDERALIGFHLNQGTALEHPHLEIQISNEEGKQTKLGDMVEKELERATSENFSRLLTPAEIETAARGAIAATTVGP